ncbi:MAG: hypothetical protein FJ290_09680 [Planctomycetes bacterium]|nr:hypothetical protein [Planctomycetota bacterium]
MAQAKTLPHEPPAQATEPYAKLDLELAAFERLRPELLKTHRGLFVAIHEGAVVDSDTDEFALAARIEDLARREGAIAVCQVREKVETEEPFPLLGFPPLEGVIR